MPPQFPNDPYETDYEEISEVEILREGVWNGFPIDGEFIEEMALTYDPNLLRAPLMFGHWGEGDGPEHGHILDLEMVDEKTDKGHISLMATIGFLKSGAEFIKEGKFNERSISWWSRYPTPGFVYLLHLALLGDANPAVTGMEPIKFSLFELEELKHMAETLNFQPDNLNWSKDEEEGDIVFRVREASRFIPGTLRVRQVSKDKGIRAKAGNLNLEYVPEGKKKDSMFNEKILFSIERGWTLKKAIAWIESKKSLEVELEDNETESNPKTLTANAEGGQKIMPTETETTAKVRGQDGAEVPVGEKLETPKVVETEKVITLVEAGSLDDKQKTTEALITEIQSQKNKTQEELDKLAVELQREKKETSLIQVTAMCRILLASGHVIPAQFELGLVELLASIPEDCAIEMTKTDGSKKVVKTRDGLLEVLKEGGRVKLRGEVSKRIDPDEEADGPNADLDRLDAKGINTKSERLRRKFIEENPKANPADIILMVEKALIKDGER